MAGETEKYKLGWLEPGDNTAAPDIERERWLTVDRQLFGLFKVLGNGIVDGWDLITSDNTVLEITVSAGSGHVDYVVADTTEATTLELTADAVNYVYAGIDLDTYYSGFTRFLVTTTTPGDDTLLYLGKVTTNPTTSTVKVEDINTDGRQQLGFREALLQLLKEHRHIGGSESPSKINLETDVQGFLQPGNMSDLDASLILRGVIDKNRLPKLDHIEDLTNQGVLTHAQLDTFVQLLDNVGSRLMGEVSTTNLLKLILALKHVYPTIDEYLVNEVAFIPGISPEDMVDKDNTTAEVDYRTAAEGGTHTISGIPADSTSTFTKTWDENEEFDETDRVGTVVYGDSLMLSALENRVFVEDFDNVSDWQTAVTDISDVSATFYTDATTKEEGDASGKLDVGDEDSESVLTLSKTFNPQDWSQYERIVFSIYTDSAEHGDIYFYLSDSEAGSQSSHKLVLERNQSTVDDATQQIGWREIVIDISSYERSNIDFVGFYVSTSAGWNTDKPFSLNVDNMFVTSGNLFRSSGTARFTYGNDFQHVFSTIRWTSSDPDGTAIRVRTRVSNESDLLDTAAWSSYITESGGTIDLPVVGAVYRYIQIEALLESDDDRKASPQIKSLMLDSTVSSADFSFDYDSSDEWKSGSLHNIDADKVEGSITVRYAGDIGTYVMGADGSIERLNSDYSEKLKLYGTSAPLSFKQMKSGSSPGFGKVVSVEPGVDGTFVISDIENDRVLEVDRDGSVVWGLMGAYPETPSNPYDDIPEATAASSSSGTATDTTQERTLEPVGCYYDLENSRLSLMFNEDLASIYETGNIDVSKIVLRAGTRRIYLGEDNSEVEMFGMDREHSSLTDLTSEFFTGSNVLLIDLAQADSVSINNISDTGLPTLQISSPNINGFESSSTVDVQFSLSNISFATECGIRLWLDSNSSIDIYDNPNYTFSNVANGNHTIGAVLIDLSGNEYTQNTASTEVEFEVNTGTHSDYHLEVTSPKNNQKLASDTLSVVYNAYNMPAGAKIRYSVDEGAAIEYDGDSPLEIDDLETGDRSIEVFIVDSLGNRLAGEMASAEFGVTIGNSGSVSFSIQVQQDAVKSSDGIGNKSKTVDVAHTPVMIANVHSPMDARVVTSDRSVGDTTAFDVVVAKVGSPSYPNFYSVDGEGFLDGHSVVQFSSSGSVRVTCNDAVIARNESEAVNYLGSVEKGGEDEFLIGDASGRRAIVSVADTRTRTTSVVWEYESERIVSDFSRVPDNASEISVDENGLSTDSLFIRRDTPITFINDASENIRILSGSTSYEQFQADPDLSLFGSDFDSGTLEPGESYTVRMINYGTYYFFVWPSITTGTVFVTENPVSPQDKFVVVENDPISSSYSSRVVRMDAWGNVEWSFGETLVRMIKDARPVSDTEVVVTV